MKNKFWKKSDGKKSSAKKTSKKVTVYTAEYCPWCKKTKEFLKENKINFIEKDIENQNNAKEMIKKSGSYTIPVTEIGKEIIVGFNEEKLKAELGI